MTPLPKRVTLNAVGRGQTISKNVWRGVQRESGGVSNSGKVPVCTNYKRTREQYATSSHPRLALCLPVSHLCLPLSPPRLTSVSLCLALCLLLSRPRLTLCLPLSHPLSHLCLALVSPSVSPLSRPRLTLCLPVSHLCLSVSRPRLTSVSPSSHLCLTLASHPS